MKNLLVSLILVAVAMSQTQVSIGQPLTNSRQVQLPYNRMIQPAGLQIFFGEKSLENHSLDAALSPDGKWLAVMERYSIIFINTSDNEVKYRLANDSHPDLKGGMNTYSGIIWHNGKDLPEVFWSVIGDKDRSFVASAKWNGVTAELRCGSDVV